MLALAPRTRPIVAGSSRSTSSAALRPWALLPLLFLGSLALGCPPQEKAVLQWDETPREAVRTGLKSLEQFKVPVDGLVINKFRATAKNYGYVAYGKY